MSARRLARVLGAVLALLLGYTVGVVWRAPARVLWHLVRPDQPPAPAADFAPGPRVPESLAGIYDSAYDDLTGFLEHRVDAARGSKPDWDSMGRGPSGQALARFKARMRGEIEAAFPPYDGVRPALAASEVPWYVDSLHSATVARIWSLPGVRTWMAVYRPLIGPGPWPTIIFLHGFTGTLESTAADMDYHHGIGAELANRGFLVIAPYVASAEEHRRARIQLLALWSGTSALNVDRWILQRVLDYVTTLPGVDTGRLGVYGISGGGENALRLAALDNRLSLAVISGFFTDRFDWWYGGRDTIRAGHLLNAMATTVTLDDMNWVALIHPRFLAAVIGRFDPRYDKTLAQWRDVRVLYASTGVSGRATLIEFNGGHETSIDAVFPFLDRWRTAPPDPPNR